VVARPDLALPLRDDVADQSLHAVCELVGPELRGLLVLSGGVDHRGTPSHAEPQHGHGGGDQDGHGPDPAPARSRSGRGPDRADDAILQLGRRVGLREGRARHRCRGGQLRRFLPAPGTPLQVPLHERPLVLGQIRQGVLGQTLAHRQAVH